MKNFWVSYIIILIAQLLLSNYFSFCPYITATVLPAMVLCIPTSIGTVGAMLIAFATGLGADFLSEGVIGLCAMSLVPVAFARNWIINIIFGPDLIVRNKPFTFRRNGLGPVAMATSIAIALYLAIFIWADTAGTRGFGFVVAKFIASFGVSLVFCLLSIRALTPSDSR